MTRVAPTRMVPTIGPCLLRVPPKALDRVNPEERLVKPTDAEGRPVQMVWE
ncbi:MAG: hypothetical protein PHP75_09380 [Methylacidiphilaceae bacterium]|nr:hypothetical protein [Candidatus Methylacidiphilaceae bacterium]